MDLIVDGVIFHRQAYGGISRIYSEILPRMCDMHDQLRIRILTTFLLKQRVPQHRNIRHLRLFPVESFFRPGRLWRPVSARMRERLQSWAIGNGEGKIWHSTYYTRLNDWCGAEVVTVHDMIHERYPALFNGSDHDRLRQQKRDCILHADAVICVSATTQRDLYEFYGLDLAKTRIVPNAHSPVFRRLNAEHIPDALPTDKPFLLYVGRRYEYKGFDTLLKGYAVWSQRKDVDLAVVGKAWGGDEKRCLMQLGIIDSVHLLTGASDQKLTQLYNGALALVHPSLYEGFGIPLLEAMACGCPVVASRIPSTAEVAGEAPLYFEPTEVESLLAALNVAYSEGRDSPRVNLGLEHVKEYSWNRTARQTLEVYRALSTAE